MISSSNSNRDFNKVTSLIVPYNLVVSSEDYYVYLVTNKEEVEVLKQLHKFNQTLPDIGLKMKTGLTVDFRNLDILRSTLYDEYYRILNGSTQVNSTEINSMPVPDIKIIRQMGRKLMDSKDLSEKNCNLILEGYCE